MFEPSDVPYKDLSYTLREYDSDILFSDSKTLSCHNKSNNYAETHNNQISTEIIHNESCINATFLTKSDNTLTIPQSEPKYEPILLDDNIVNQFLLPLKISEDENTKKDFLDSSAMSVQTCVMCHEIFLTESDLLDHTINVHASDNMILEKETSLETLNNINEKDLELLKSSNYENTEGSSSINTSVDLETEWLVCCICDRVLSMALEVEPIDQLCCNDGSGKSKVMNRKLNTMYVCDYCNGLFADGDSLDKHKSYCQLMSETYYTPETNLTATDSSFDITQPTNVYYNCEECKKQFESSQDLQMHIKSCHFYPTARSDRPYSSTSTNNKMWNCGSCNQLFATARELYRHKRGEDRPAGAPLTAFICEECDKVLGSMCALHTHKKIHKVSKPGYSCRICGRRFNQSGHLAIHMRMHTGERPYPCDLCSKAFKVKVERDDHRRTHTGERPFACSECPKTFTAAARLREHARIHTDQRPYRCDICGAAFRRPYARTVHTLIHTGEKPHSCDICGTAFRRSGDMWKHKRTIHGTSTSQEDSKKA